MHRYQVKNFSALLGMDGFSDGMLKAHFKLYEGYVTKVNLLLAVSAANRHAAKESPFSDWHGHFGFEFNGMRLHELYFENMLKNADPTVPGPVLEKMAETFVTRGDWAKDFKATGSLRGVGWAVLYFDNQSGNLFNQWTSEHQVNHLADCTPLLVMDAWEHAFMTDYKFDRAAYIEAFFKNINWEPVEARLKAAMERAKSVASR